MHLQLRVCQHYNSTVGIHTYITVKSPTALYLIRLASPLTRSQRYRRISYPDWIDFGDWKSKELYGFFGAGECVTSVTSIWISAAPSSQFKRGHSRPATYCENEPFPHMIQLIPKTANTCSTCTAVYIHYIPVHGSSRLGVELVVLEM